MSERTHSIEASSDPMPSDVNIVVPASVFNNLEQMFETTRAVLGRLGCPSCHSGRILRYQEEVTFLANVRGGKINVVGVTEIGLGGR